MKEKIRTREIKKIDPISAGLMLSIIYAIIGFFFAVAIIIINPLLGLVSFSELGFLAVLAVVLYTLVFFIIGLLTGLVGSVVYNFVAKRIGGIKIKLN